ncbi:MAG: hypothetical protein LBU97_04910 [Alistipes sp.]|jgi:hypothetical protein|nr:hypothetical protein [Alistipes sp.]
MVRLKSLIPGAMLVAVWLVCASDIAPVRYGGWTPYFMQRAELERSVSMASAPREMENPGKIWIDGDNIYVVERYRGVHIIDNSDPAAPLQSGFIVAPGCMDVALRGGIVYLDNAVDLVAFDPATGTVTERLRDYFPEPASPTGDRYYNNSGMILVGWRQIEKEEGRP